jgi:predicted TIM-barrel fold metal-dependent hydrolase
MLVDCHMHSWRWPQHFNKEVMLLNQPARRRTWTEDKWAPMWDNPIERYIEQMPGCVDKAILLGIKSWNTFSVDTPNEYLAEIAERYAGKIAWCCIVNPAEDSAAKEVERCIKRGAIGIGELGPAYSDYFVNDKRADRVWALAQEMGIPVIIHAGPSQARMLKMAQGDVLLVDEVAIKFPNLKIVICHMGYYKYDDAIFLCQKHENIYLDMSWLTGVAGLDRISTPRYLPVVTFPYCNLLYPILAYFSQTFGPTDKLIWGSDWTGASPKKSVEIIRNLNTICKQYNLPEIPQQSLENILTENWKKVFPTLA